MSVSIDVHLHPEDTRPSRVLFVESTAPGRPTAAVKVHEAVIYFSKCAQIRQLIDTLWEAERQLFALESPEMQEKAVQADEDDDAPCMDYSLEDAALRDEEEAEAEHFTNELNSGMDRTTAQAEDALA